VPAWAWALVAVAGLYVDDAVLVVWALRSVVRAAGREVVADHWPGPERGLALVLRAAAA
jgi:hypothetical protein